MPVRWQTREDGVRIAVLDFYDQHGRRIRERMLDPTKKAADARYKQRLHEVAEGTYRHAKLDPAAPSTSFAAFVRDRIVKPGASGYQTWSVAALLKFFGDDPLASITLARAEEFRVSREAEGVSSSTLRYELGKLRTIVRAAWIPRLVSAEQVQDFALLRLPRKDKTTGVYHHPEQRAALLAACRPWLRRIVEWCYLTGFDRADALTLDWSQIDLEFGIVDATRVKTGVPRLIPLTPRLRAILAATRVRRIDGTGRVFRNLHGDPVGTDAMKAGLARAYRRAGLPVERPAKALRHTFATLGRLAGVDGAVIAALMGHAPQSMTAVYGQHPLETLRDAMLRIDAVFDGRILDGNEAVRASNL